MADDIRLARIEDKIDKVIEHTASMDITLARNTDSLVAHMQRTEILEKALLPIRNVYDYAVMTLKILGALAIVAGAVEAIIFIYQNTRK